jgi:hypothetical protein
VSYQAQWLLTYDDPFTARSRAAIINQATIFKDDARPDIATLAESLLRGGAAQFGTFQSLLGAAPGFADKADNGDGTVDSSKIADAEILSAVQADFPTVAALYFTADGTPIP